MILGVFEGKARYQRSGRDSPSHGKAEDERCICCIGPHVFSNGLELDIDVGKDMFRGIQNRIADIISTHRNDPTWDGKRLRVTVETVE